MTVEIRSIVEGELQAYIDACTRGFGSDMLEGESERVTNVIGLERCHGAFADGRVVGTSGSYGFPMTVPGAADVATAGLTRVTVAATHRRQGVLTSMMHAHFRDAGDHGEALSALWASESAIYGRYGYGLATDFHQLSFDARLAHISRPETLDRLDIVDADEAAKILPEIRERSRVLRPGMFGRSESWWTHRTMPDHKDLREGKSSRRYVVARRAGEAVGYVSFRQKSSWGDSDLPEGEIHIVELCGVDRRAEHGLWWHVANIDLFPHIVSWNQPTDSLLPWLAINARAVLRRYSDGLYLRVLDVEGILNARRYTTAAELVFELRDDRLPELAGVYRLSVDETGAGRCRRSDDEPELRISAYALGALYLGSTRPEPMAAIGHIEAVGESHGEGGGEPMMGRLRNLFGWPVAAWCDEMF